MRKFQSVKAPCSCREKGKIKCTHGEQAEIKESRKLLDEPEVSVDEGRTRKFNPLKVEVELGRKRGQVELTGPKTQSPQ
jgi:hypothetical protein